MVVPVTLAGLGHVAVLKWKLFGRLAVSLDAGREWRGQPILGANKTWRGVMVMVSLGALFTGVQSAVERRMRRDPCLTLEYRVNPWLAGGLMGLGYCLGEIPNSLVKRRLGILPGARHTRAGSFQYLVDQVDSVAACLLVLRMLSRPRPWELSAALLMGTAIHICVDALLYLSGIKRRG